MESRQIIAARAGIVPTATTHRQTESMVERISNFCCAVSSEPWMGSLSNPRDLTKPVRTAQPTVAAQN